MMLSFFKPGTEYAYGKTGRNDVGIVRLIFEINGQGLSRERAFSMSEFDTITDPNWQLNFFMEAVGNWFANRVTDTCIIEPIVHRDEVDGEVEFIEDEP